MQSDIVYLFNLIFQSNGDSDTGGEKFVIPSSAVLKRLGIKLDQYNLNLHPRPPILLTDSFLRYFINIS